MCQQSDLIFLELLRQAYLRGLTVEDVINLNNTVVTALKPDDLLNNIIIVQYIKIKHLIN